MDKYSSEESAHALLDLLSSDFGQSGPPVPYLAIVAELDNAFVAGSSSAHIQLRTLCKELAEALQKLRADEWRCTVDWGPTDERYAINDVCDAALTKYRQVIHD